MAHADSICRDIGVAAATTGVLAPVPLLDLLQAALLTASMSHGALLSSDRGFRAPGRIWFCVSPVTALAKFLVVNASSDLIGVVSTAAGDDDRSESAAMQACTVTPEQPPAADEAAIAGGI